MRISIALAGVLIAAPVAAHDSMAPLEGEQAVEQTHVMEEVWNLLLPKAEASADISVDSNYRHIHADGYPVKPPGKFPNRGNPHSISKKNYNLKVPLVPHKNSSATRAQGAVFGIAVNGVVMDPGTAEFWQNDRRSGWNYEALGGACKLGLDRYNAHVQPDGTYHYHGIPTGVMASKDGKSVPALLGFAADGFPIYGPYGYSDPKRNSGLKKLNSSYRVKKGNRPGGPGGRYNGKFTQDWAYVAGAGDLDQCNGRFAATPEYPNGTYHYVLTDAFPFIPRCWMGNPDSSFMRLKRGGMRGEIQNESDLPTVDFAALSDNSEAAVVLVQAQGGHPPRFLHGGRPPPPGLGSGHGPGFGSRNGGPPPGARPEAGRGGRSPCSGS